MKWLPILFLALLAGCDGIPKDPDGTLDRIRQERRFRVGLVSNDDPVGQERRRLFLSRIGKATASAPVIQAGAAERLLTSLEEGKLDLVIGEFAPVTPWTKKVTLIPPLAEQVSRDGHSVLAAAARNGENAWIALLTREARVVAAKP